MKSTLALAIFESDWLWQLQEQNLFLATPMFFEEHVSKAGGVLTWASAYLTQFFYYPALGAGLLCLLWAFLIWLVRKAMDAPLWLAIMMVACLLTTIVDLGYWVYYLKLPGHPFVATLGIIVALLLALPYRYLPRHYYMPRGYIVVAACVGYPLFGFYGSLAVLLMALMAFCKGRKGLIDGMTALVMMIVVPLLAYCCLYHETHISNIYWAALPVYGLVGKYYPSYYLPYIILVLCTLLAVCGKYGKSSLLSITLHRSSHSVAGKLLTYGMPLISIICVVMFWQKDDNFHREMSMTRSMSNQDWQQMLLTAKEAKGEPTRAICMMKNLALFRLDRQVGEMFCYPEGAKRPDAPFAVRMVHTVGKQLYLQYGLPNYCYRWCMEDGVEYGWTVERLKLMTLCSILNREWAAAKKYINLLKKTTFHKAWALQYEQCVYNPVQVTQNRMLRPILPLLRSDNFLTADQSQLESFLIEHILSTPGNTREQRKLAQWTMYYYRQNKQKIAEP